jgi:hypothetical protein
VSSFFPTLPISKEESFGQIGDTDNFGDKHFWRNLGTVTVTVTDGKVFGDGFESGDLTAWSVSVP